MLQSKRNVKGHSTTDLPVCVEALRAIAAEAEAGSRKHCSRCRKSIWVLYRLEHRRDCRGLAFQGVSMFVDCTYIILINLIYTTFRTQAKNHRSCTTFLSIDISDAKRWCISSHHHSVPGLQRRHTEMPTMSKASGGITSTIKATNSQNTICFLAITKEGSFTQDPSGRCFVKEPCLARGSVRSEGHMSWSLPQDL